jgi:hypothetical protein
VFSEKFWCRPNLREWWVGVKKCRKESNANAIGLQRLVGSYKQANKKQ